MLISVVVIANLLIICCHQFEMVDVKLPHRESNLAVGQWNNDLFIINSVSYHISSELNSSDSPWTQQVHINVPFDYPSLVKFYDHSYVQSNNLLYGIPWIRSGDSPFYVYHQGTNLVIYNFINNEYIDSGFMRHKCCIQTTFDSRYFLFCQLN
eukprot:476496_1